MKKSLLFLVAAFISVMARAQDFPYGQLDNQALDMKKYDKDTSAHALVLQEYGSSRLTSINGDNIDLIYEYHVRIKIFDTRGFDNGAVAIKLRNTKDNGSKQVFESRSFKTGIDRVNIRDENDNDSRRKLDDISGITYYNDENGLTRKIELDNKEIHRAKDNNGQTITTFTLPALHNGCVIEYRYTITYPIDFVLDHFMPWQFQGNIPKLSSEYEVHIPAHFVYNASLTGPLKLTINKSTSEMDCFSTMGSTSDCSDIIYGINDIPAFVEEDYMTAPKNFRSAMEFRLREFVNPFTTVKIYVQKQWKDIDGQLKSDGAFGSQLKKTDPMKERVATAIAGRSAALDKAKAIYSYLQKWYKWNNNDGIFSNEGIKKTFDAHSGNVADINLALVAALNSAGINTEAVIIATRDHGVVNDEFPALNDFNYVVAKANIGDVSYLLDATDPLLAFGILPLKCLNDRGRVFSLNKPSYWIDMNTPQKETGTYTFDLTLQDDGKLKGTMIFYSAGYKAYTRRREIGSFGTIADYVKNLDERVPGLKITRSALKNIDSLDEPVTETYEVEFEGMEKQNLNQAAFNPFIFNRVQVNPFKLTDRPYPVDFGMPSDTRVVLTMHLPDNFTIENPPANTAIALPGNGGRFLTNFENNGNWFTFSHVVQFTKPVYDPNDYPYLKEFYDKIILSEKTDLVFKKKM